MLGFVQHNETESVIPSDSEESSASVNFSPPSFNDRSSCLIINPTRLGSRKIYALMSS